MFRKCGLVGGWAAWAGSILVTEKPGFELGLVPALCDPERVRILWEWKGWRPPHCDTPHLPRSTSPAVP